MKFKQPKFWKTLERHPLSAEYEDLVGDPWNQLIADLETNGFDESRPIILYEDKILDGWQRQRACVACDLKPVYAPIPKGLTPEQLVERSNDNRRHETDSQRERRIATRKMRVGEGRAEGKSIRELAEEEGVGKTTIERDLEELGPVPPGTPDEESPAEERSVGGKTGKVMGRDGKIYSAHNPVIRCPRCERLWPNSTQNVAGCPNCEELRQGKKKPPVPDFEPKQKSGKANRFDEKKFTDAYGKLTRCVDERAGAKGKGAHHKRCLDILSEFLTEYKLWLKETA